MRPRETPNLQRWREATRQSIATAHGAADLFTEYLVAGGPDAIKSLQATIRKLQALLEDQKADGRLERYRKLQKDLEECDKVRVSLRAALVSCQWTEDAVDAYIQKKLFKASTLYGASREMLLRENRLLRSQLEEHLLTSRTSRPVAGTPGDTPSRATPPDSQLKQARMMQGPHMEVVAQLREAAGALDQAERAFKLPYVRHAEVQAVDGSVRVIQTLEQQVAALAGQKLQLLQQVAAMSEQCRATELKMESALDQVAELRRQKTDMLAHQENLSKDLREHLLAEAKRADTVEAALAEAKLSVAAAQQAEAAAVQSMESAMAEARASQAALQEKAQQVDTLRGLYLELRETLERLAGDVSSGQQEAVRRLLEATREHFLDQRALLEDVRTAAVDTQRAALHATETTTELAVQQRVLVSEVMESGKADGVALGALERQLDATQQLLQQSEADRVRLARQALAASALSRMENHRHDKTLQLLLREVPHSVARHLRPGLQALAEGTQQLAQELEATNTTLAEVAVSGGGRARAHDRLHAPMVPDEVDDATTELLANSRLLRAQLVNLTPPSGPGVAAHEFDDPALSDLAPSLPGHVLVLQQQPDMTQAAVGEDGRAPVMELVAAAPSFRLPPPGIVPSAYLGAEDYTPGPPAMMPMHPAGFRLPYEAMQMEPAYMVPTHLASLHPPTRLDLVLLMPTEEGAQPLPQPPPQPQPQPQPTSQPLRQPPLLNMPTPRSQQSAMDTKAGTQQQVAAGTEAPPPPAGLRDGESADGGQQRDRGAQRAGDQVSMSRTSEHLNGVGTAPQPASGTVADCGVSGAAVDDTPAPVAVPAEKASARAAGPVTAPSSAEDSRVGMPATGAANGVTELCRVGASVGAPQKDRVDGERPSAHVWVPSQALLEAFNNVQL